MKTDTKQTENLAGNGNKSKPLLSSRLYFKAWSNELKTMSKPFTFGQVLNFNDTNIKTLTDEVVLQFIWLQDKNGKDICEGDILCDYRLDGTYRMYKIFKSKGGFVFNTHQDDFKKPINQILFTESCSDMQNAGFLETCEIEGNIWTYVW